MNLSDFKGMTWKEAQSELSVSLPLLALSDDITTRQCAKAIQGYGTEAGAAILCSYLFMEENGVVRTINQGIIIYKEILKTLEDKGQDVSWTRNQVQEMEGWMAWLRGGPACKAIEWPMKFPFRNKDKKAGLANIMLWTGAMNLEGGNTSLIAANAVTSFLTEGLKRKKKHGSTNGSNEV
jgi:hypothetical protein